MNRVSGLFLEITSNCNKRCTYCYNDKILDSKIEMSLDNIFKIVSELKKHNIMNVTISGGEPFLHPKIYDVLLLLEEVGIEITIISNGTCFIKENIYILRRFQPRLQITFDGYDSKSHDATRGKGNFDLLLNGLKNARNEGFVGFVGARVNLHKYNINYVNEILDQITKLNINSINLSLLHDANNNSAFDAYLKKDEYLLYPNAMKILRDSREKDEINYDFDNPDIGCPFNDQENINCGIKISPTGDVYPCQLFHDDLFIIGNIFEDSLDYIINGEKMNQFLKKIGNRKITIEQCKLCGYKFFCGCGCPAQAYLENKTLFSISQPCKLRKDHFNNSIRMLLKNKEERYE